MVSIVTKRLPIVPLLIAGQSICGAAPTESASIGNAGRVYPHAGWPPLKTMPSSFSNCC